MILKKPFPPYLHLGTFTWVPTASKVQSKTHPRPTGDLRMDQTPLFGPYRSRGAFDHTAPARQTPVHAGLAANTHLRSCKSIAMTGLGQRSFARRSATKRYLESARTSPEAGLSRSHAHIERIVRRRSAPLHTVTDLVMWYARIPRPSMVWTDRTRTAAVEAAAGWDIVDERGKPESAELAGRSLAETVTDRSSNR